MVTAMNSKRDEIGMCVAVVGAGIIGLSSAVSLQRRGAQVTVFDSLPPGGGASYGNAGLLSVDTCTPISLPGALLQVPRWLMDPLGPLAINPRYALRATPWLLKWLRAGRMDRVVAASDALRALHMPALDHYRELLGPRHFDDLIRVTGQIHLYDGERESAGERITHQLYERHGIIATPLDDRQLHELIPDLAPSVRRGVLLPKNGYTVNPHRLVQCLAELHRVAGGKLRHESVMKILLEPGPSYRLLTTQGDRRFHKLLVAAGAFSMRLLAPLGVHMPLETERGYHVTIPNPAVDLRIPLLHKTRGFAATPMEIGLRLAGTVEIAGLEAAMNERRAEVLLRQGKMLFPSLQANDFSAWMGFRPSLPDSVPVIDESAHHSGLFIACGHGHFGMIAGATTGRLVSQLMLGERPFVDPSPYSLARFG